MASEIAFLYFVRADIEVLEKFSLGSSYIWPRHSRRILALFICGFALP
jgi:hypothetical protein